MVVEQEPLPIFPVEDTALRWFAPEQLARQQESDLEWMTPLEEAACRLGALLGCDPDHPDVVGPLEEFAAGKNLTHARNLVRMVVDIAHKEFSLAYDSLTGLKTLREHERWLSSTYGQKPSEGSEERRQPNWRKRSYFRLQIDFHNFKRVNDLLGEEPIGDEVLREGAAELLENLRVGDHMSVFRTHGKGDEIGVAVSRISKQTAFNFWQRLCRTQDHKIQNGRQRQIWDMIEEAITACPDTKNYKHLVKTRPEQQVQPNGKVIEARVLWINKRRICNLRELAVLDIGYAYGKPPSYDDIKALDAEAGRHRDEVKEEKRSLTGGRYRNAGMS